MIFISQHNVSLKTIDALKTKRTPLWNGFTNSYNALNDASPNANLIENLIYQPRDKSTILRAVDEEVLNFTFRDKVIKKDYSKEFELWKECKVCKE